METPKFKATWVFDVTLGDLRAGVPYIWHEGGTRSGKTHNIVAACLLHVAETGQSLDVVRAANTTLKGTIVEEDLLPLAKRLGLYDEARHNKSEQVFYVGQGRVRYYGVDEGQKVKGKKRDILLMNEANEIDSAKRRQLWMRTTGTIIIDHNPTVDDEHWIVKLLDPKVASGECHYYHSTYLDNPFLPEQQVRNIESMQYDDPYGWTIYGLGLRASNPAAVFTDVRLGTFDPQLDTVYGTDFGFKEPFVVCEWGWRDSDPPERPRAILYCRPLVYATHLTTGDAIDQLREKKSGQAQSDVVRQRRRGPHPRTQTGWIQSSPGEKVL